MNGEDKNIIYTAGDIQKYLAGQMTAAEMHAIEKAALDDPFLAEAIEGYSSVEDKDWNKELAELKKNFNKKENTPVIPIAKPSFAKWWKAAAAVLIIGTSVTIAYLFSGNNNSVNKQDIAQAAVTDSAASPAVDSAVAINEKKDSVSTGTVVATNAASANGIASIPQTSTEQTLIAEVKPGSQAEDNGFVYKPSPQPVNGNSGYAKDVVAADEAVKQNTEEMASVKKLPSTTNTNAPVNEAEFDKNAAAQVQGNLNKEISNNSFNAQVVTEDNKPVAFAQVNIPKSKNAVYTDANGNFNISAPDSALDVVVTSAGYAAKRSKLQNAAVQNKIVLKANENQLAETVAVGKKRDVKKKELKETKNTTEEDDEEEEAEPEVGWSEYNNYLNNNLVMPGDAKEKNIHGVVEVFVNLTKNGSIKEVKVDKPLCAGCDAEAIRLIKEGPKWDVKKNKPAKVKVKVTF